MNHDKCNEDIYSKGKVVAVMDCPKLVMNAICEEVSKRYNIEIDWHYVGGRCIVKTLEDVDKAKTSLLMALPEMLN